MKNDELKNDWKTAASNPFRSNNYLNEIRMPNLKFDASLYNDSVSYLEAYDKHK